MKNQNTDDIKLKPGETITDETLDWTLPFVIMIAIGQILSRCCSLPSGATRSVS